MTAAHQDGSPGREALAEAARLEAARVYGATVAEHRADVRPVTRAGGRPAAGVELDAAIAYWSRQGLSPASVAFRLRCSRRYVVEVLARLERAS